MVRFETRPRLRISQAVMVMAEAEEVAGMVKCPVCAGEFRSSQINAHLDECLDVSSRESIESLSDPPPAKKSRVSNSTGTESAAIAGTCPGTTKSKRPPVAGMFSVFKPKASSPCETDSCKSNADTFTSETAMLRNTAAPLNAAPAAQLTSRRLESINQNLLNTNKPLADKMRPNTLEEYFGQNKVLGEHTLLRSLLQAQEIPSLILWGPPGCGKVSSITRWTNTPST